MRGITRIYPHPSDRPYPSQVPVAGEGVRIRPDTAMEMRKYGIYPWTPAGSKGRLGQEPRGPGIVG
jgi:hypothetical protein